MKDVIVHCKTLSNRDSVALSLLLDNAVFRDYIISARKKYEIPEDGLEFKRVYVNSKGILDYELTEYSNTIYSKLHEDIKNFIRISINVIYINSSFNLGARWFTPILESLLFGQIVHGPRAAITYKVTANIMGINQDDEVDDSNLLKSKKELIIEISEKMNLSQLISNLRKLDKKGQLSQSLNMLSGPPTKPDLSKIQDKSKQK